MSTSLFLASSGYCPVQYYFIHTVTATLSKSGFATSF